MKIRTDEELLNKLDEYSSWRKRELIYIKNSVVRSKGNYDEIINIRIAIVLLYAHFEGFIKETSYAYIYFLNGKKVSLSQINLCFKNLRIFDEIKKFFLHDEVKYDKFLDLVNELPNNATNNFFFKPEKVINTNSNLNSTVFRDIVYKLGLNYRLFELKEKLIDFQLVDNRNKVAHGEYKPLLSFDQTIELFDEVISIMEIFKTEIINSVETEAYLINHP